MPEKQTLKLTAAMFRLKQNYINVENEKIHWEFKKLFRFCQIINKSNNSWFENLTNPYTQDAKAITTNNETKKGLKLGIILQLFGPMILETSMASDNCGKNCEFRNSSVVLPEKNGQCW